VTYVVVLHHLYGGAEIIGVFTDPVEAEKVAAFFEDNVSPLVDAEASVHHCETDPTVLTGGGQTYIRDGDEMKLFGMQIMTDAFL